MHGGIAFESFNLPVLWNVRIYGHPAKYEYIGYSKYMPNPVLVHTVIKIYNL
jgi:hypothetical protein